MCHRRVIRQETTLPESDVVVFANSPYTTGTVKGATVGRFLVLIGTSLGGALGWGLGSAAGLIGSVFLAIIGAAAGSWLSRRYIRDHLP